MTMIGVRVGRAYARLSGITSLRVTAKSGKAQPDLSTVVQSAEFRTLAASAVIIKLAVFLFGAGGWFRRVSRLSGGLWIP